MDKTALVYAVLLLIPALFVQYLVMHARDSRRKGKGMIESGHKSIASANEQIHKGHQLMRHGLLYYLILVPIAAAAAVLISLALGKP
jgi:hypothetical protein